MSRVLFLTFELRFYCIVILGLFYSRFGKIQGLSTRKGNIVLLSNIIEEAKLRMQSIQECTGSIS